MNVKTICIAFICATLMCSCKNVDSKKTAATEKLSAEEKLIYKRIDSLKEMAQEGDLITRMNDNIVSYHVKNLNSRDKSFSHAGIIVMRNGKKMVCNIDADAPGIDTVRFDPIDSFINPKENFLCGLFRFELNDKERRDFVSQLAAFHDAGVHFDRVYDLETDSAMYCSEMISKSLTKVTNGRIVFQHHALPQQMIPLIIKFFMQESHKPEPYIRKIVLARRYVGIDDLYLDIPCKELMRFKLKYFAGQ